MARIDRWLGRAVFACLLFGFYGGCHAYHPCHPCHHCSCRCVRSEGLVDGDATGVAIFQTLHVRNHYLCFACSHGWQACSLALLLCDCLGLTVHFAWQNNLLQQEKEADYTESFKGLKTFVIEKINDLLEELQNTAHDIAEQSLEHIHSNEVIMTLGGGCFGSCTRLDDLSKRLSP